VGRSSATAIAYSAHAVVRNETLSVMIVATDTEEGIATDRAAASTAHHGVTSLRASR